MTTPPNPSKPEQNKKTYTYKDLLDILNKLPEGLLAQPITVLDGWMEQQYQITNILGSSITPPVLVFNEDNDDVIEPDVEELKADIKASIDNGEF